VLEIPLGGVHGWIGRGSLQYLGVINLLAEARLVSVVEGSVEVTHEGTIREWYSCITREAG